MSVSKDVTWAEFTEYFRRGAILKGKWGSHLLYTCTSAVVPPSKAQLAIPILSPSYPHPTSTPIGNGNGTGICICICIGIGFGICIRIRIRIRVRIRIHIRIPIPSGHPCLLQ